MKISFVKFHGTGNDFILLDNRKKVVKEEKLTHQAISGLCNRRTGIGADGLMLLQERDGYDFEMIYYNSDGRQSSMCGNGGRCIAAFARMIGAAGDIIKFIAVDGEHDAVVKQVSDSEWEVDLKMIDVPAIEVSGNECTLNTGSPHYVSFINSLDRCDVVTEGRRIRYSPKYAAEGINVNFVEAGKDQLKVRTYERGVEDETMSCGTGVTAVAIAASCMLPEKKNDYRLLTPGGLLKVRFNRNDDGSFTDVWLKGPAVFVFEGVLSWL